MAHHQQLEFISLVEEYFVRRHKPDVKVLEVGTYDLNGSARQFFSGCDFLGVDLTEGPGVDLLCSGHEIDLPASSFDIVLSCECFEHNPYWIETFRNMYRMVSPGGLVVITCASRGRMEHGTVRTTPETSPGTQAVGLDYYKNLNRRDFEKVFKLNEMFGQYIFSYISTSKDLYFCGWKIGTNKLEGDICSFKLAVKTIKSMPDYVVETCWQHRAMSGIYQLPITLASYLLNDQSFQNFSIRYVELLAPIKTFLKISNEKKYQFSRT